MIAFVLQSSTLLFSTPPVRICFRFQILRRVFTSTASYDPCACSSFAFSWSIIPSILLSNWVEVFGTLFLTWYRSNGLRKRGGSRQDGEFHPKEHKLYAENSCANMTTNICFYLGISELTWIRNTSTWTIYITEHFRSSGHILGEATSEG